MSYLPLALAGQTTDVKLCAAPQQGDVDESLGLTPRTAADLVAKTAKKDGPSPAKKQKLKKALVDKSIELDWSKEKGSKQDKENLFTEAHYLPSSRLHLRLLELNAAPVSHQLPTAHPLSPDYFLVAPPGIAPELAQLFKFPSRRAKIAAAGAERAPEVGRGVAARESVAGDAVLEEFDFGDFGNGGGEQGGEFDYGDDQGYIPDQAHFEIVEMDDVAADAVAPITASQKKKGKAVERDDFSIGGGGDSTGLLAVFDSSSSMAFSATQQTQTQTQSLGAEEEETGKEGAWSKNTFKALGVLRSQLVEKDEVTVADIAVGVRSILLSRRAVLTGLYCRRRRKQQQPSSSSSSSWEARTSSNSSRETRTAPSSSRLATGCSTE